MMATLVICGSVAVFVLAVLVARIVERERLRGVPMRDQIRADNLRELTNPRLFTR